MNQSNSPETLAILDQAVAGDKKALETILVSVQDLVFNLSLRMLGAFADAEDATQDILIKVITHLSAFKKESSFTTWVFRIAVNHLKNYQKHLFAHAPLNFSYYAHDITEGQLEEIPDLAQDVERPVLSEELKLSCTNVMLQCLDTQSRCIFVLGTMFHLDSRIAGDLLGMSAQAYRQKLSRTRKKMAAFLQAYCGEYGKGACKCQNRIHYAIAQHRLDPHKLSYTTAAEIPLSEMYEVKQAMEEIDDLSWQFAFCKTYRSPESARQFIRDFLNSTQLAALQHNERSEL